MQKVFKYLLPVFTHSEIQMPEGAKILHVAVQAGYPFIWALVNPDAPLKTRSFDVYATGHEIINPAFTRKFIGTFFVNGGEFVFHVFETT